MIRGVPAGMPSRCSQFGGGVGLGQEARLNQLPSQSRLPSLGLSRPHYPQMAR